jgi:hypothetical protein
LFHNSSRMNWILMAAEQSAAIKLNGGSAACPKSPSLHTKK